MRTLGSIVIGVLVLGSLAAAQSAPSADVQIAGAVQAAPEDRRSGAAVLGYDAAGKFGSLRAGTNDLVCLADDPKTEGFNVACYQRDLDPFMARGRELTAQGITNDNVRDETRWKEIEAGTLTMPREARTLYVMTGKRFEPTTGTVETAYLRYVLYLPFATAASTGLGTKSLPGVPWLMTPGTAGAHIMISPPKP